MKFLGSRHASFVPRSLVSLLLLAASLSPDSVNPLVLCSVIELPEACPDGSDNIPKTTCRWIEVSCEGMTPLRAQLRITEPVRFDRIQDSAKNLTRLPTSDQRVEGFVGKLNSE